MSDIQYYIATDNYSLENDGGQSIDISIGNQFVLLEDLQNGNFRLKSIDTNLIDQNEIILPQNILENMSSDSPRKPARIMRSQSAAKDWTYKSVINDKSNDGLDKCRFSTFGHGSDGMTQSMSREKNRTRILPLTTLNKEILQPELVDESNKNENVEVENVTVMRKTYDDNKWKIVKENGVDVHVNVETGERWYSTIDDSGRKYFYNESSRMSTWKLPDHNLRTERAYDDETMTLKEEVLERVQESADNDESSEGDFSNSENGDEEPLPSPPILTPDNNSVDVTDGSSRFNIRHIKKEHISGPLFNKLMKTERSGFAEKTKISENGKNVSKKWALFHIILTGPELLFYKDIKAVVVKPGMPQGKIELKLKIQNLQFTEKPESNSKGFILQIEDTGAPGSNITYLLRFSKADEMKSWKVALQLAKDWQNENLYSENAFNTESGTVDDSSGDIQNIGLKLKQFLKKRPTRESLELRGILKTESVFGSSLNILCEQEKGKVPEFVFRCILAIEARGLHHSGLYRISGNQAKIQKLRLAVDENKYQLNSESMELETLTGAFKWFFKELKEPLFDEDFCTKMVDILSHRKADKKNPYRDVNLSSAKKLISKLKPSHYETAKALLGHLNKVASFSSKNLMDVSNLSMVWGPNLYLVTGQASTKLAVNLMTHNMMIDFLITCYSEMFGKV